MGCTTSKLVVPPVGKSRVRIRLLDTTRSVSSQPDLTTSAPFSAINTNPLGRQNVENFALVWLDAAHKQTELEAFQRICNGIYPIPTIDECCTFIASVKNEKIFIIVSGSLGQQIISHIHSNKKIDSIYVFCADKQKHEKWALSYPIIKGVYTNINLIYAQLVKDTKRVEQNLIGFDVVKLHNTTDSKNEQDVDFMYAQLIKDALLKLSDSDMTDMITFCRTQYEGNSIELKLIDEFERDYKDKSQAIWWYTRESFLYKMLNKALRTLDIDVMYALRIFIRHLHEQLSEVAHEQSTKQSSIQTLYRGQGLTKQEFQQLKSNEGGFFSVKAFLSTSRNEKTALWFANRCDGNVIRVIMVLNIDLGTKLNIPVANVETLSAEQDEQEYLISMGSVFRIGALSERDDGCWSLPLVLTTEADPELVKLTESFKKQYRSLPPIAQLFLITKNMGHPRAENFSFVIAGGDYWRRAEKTGSEPTQQQVLKQLFQKLETARTHVNEDDPSLLKTYALISYNYVLEGEQEKALEYEIKQLQCMNNDPKATLEQLTMTLDSVAGTFKTKKDYSNALMYYERSLARKQKELPDIHPDIAKSFNMIASCQYELKQFSDALPNAQKAVAIAQRSLPQDSHITRDYENNLQRIQNALNE
jgi:hypothetical protein